MKPFYCNHVQAWLLKFSNFKKLNSFIFLLIFYVWIRIRRRPQVLFSERWNSL